MKKWEVWFKAYSKNYAGTGLLNPEVVAEQAWQAAETVAAERVSQLESDRAVWKAEAGRLFEERDRLREALKKCEPIGAWMSAAMEDPGVCSEMKRDILIYFEGLEGVEFGDALATTRQAQQASSGPARDSRGTAAGSPSDGIAKPSRHEDGPETAQAGHTSTDDECANRPPQGTGQCSAAPDLSTAAQDYPGKCSVCGTCWSSADLPCPICPQHAAQEAEGQKP